MAVGSNPTRGATFLTRTRKPKSHPAEGALCLSCGMCCDNTMFGRVIVSRWEAARLSRKGVVIDHYDDGERSFAQPCPRFADGCCGIYTSRPHTCRAYVCETVHALRAGDISAEDAQARVDTTLAARAALAPQAGNLDLFEYRNAITDALEAGADPASLPGCTQELVELETLLNRWFRKQDYAKRVPECG
ncbi:YkgJ family cysteine cluster protein [Alteraurantiacibacter palmitatis]|uniref:YkgJ family cysteine cluster protein n=1 Tax=Alteraurantiacibacter palmitatis TaxID=2054628 RepID=A0ABV7E306_9SPHN